MNDVGQRWSVGCEKQKSQDRALSNTSKKFNWRGGVVAKFHIQDSIRKVRLYPKPLIPKSDLSLSNSRLKST